MNSQALCLRFWFSLRFWILTFLVLYSSVPLSGVSCFPILYIFVSANGSEGVLVHINYCQRHLWLFFSLKATQSRDWGRQECVCIYFSNVHWHSLGGEFGIIIWMKGGRNCWLAQNERRWVQGKQPWFEGQVHCLFPLFLVLNPTKGLSRDWVVFHSFIHSTNAY